MKCDTHPLTYLPPGRKELVNLKVVLFNYHKVKKPVSNCNKEPVEKCGKVPQEYCNMYPVEVCDLVLYVLLQSFT